MILPHSYAVLVLNSFGLQHAIDHPALTGLDKPMYYMRCLTAARGMVQAAFALGPVMRYAPDSQYVMITYACVFLLKLIRPAFSGYSDEDSVVQTVSQTASFLDELAVNETHTPALYATFLRTLLQSRLDQTEGTRSGAATPHRGSRAGTPSGAADATETTTLHNTDHNGQSGMAAFNGNAIDPSIVNRGPAVSGGITMMPGGRDDLAINTMQGMDATQMLNAVNNNTDQLLNESFWSSLLPPGFGGPLDGTGGHGLDTIPATSIFCNHQQTLAATPGVTPGITRPSTPSMMNSFPVGLTFNP
ncbi:hypothetical protein K437DRAFT_270795 [Tilletiaria anomala UBC 951]|uniref:Transcription factor domain-containing protein n=1 Tax=Tilletiaria anomala (strain ATCC 24038 / CBS 436.72 / UBC 951) TaxID=1037660 RepID=A0A066VFZ1_TILAU|nr:uncharacterized protein K437DRAFT_270795 [Tilletiaria anomala UBC 951]KDN37689.1 hypothetical protein K437DRAFT_270795 [Tilletiaria anomala UBC 951]